MNWRFRSIAYGNSLADSSKRSRPNENSLPLTNIIRETPHTSLWSHLIILSTHRVCAVQTHTTVSRADQLLQIRHDASMPGGSHRGARVSAVGCIRLMGTSFADTVPAQLSSHLRAANRETSRIRLPDCMCCTSTLTSSSSTQHRSTNELYARGIPISRLRICAPMWFTIDAGRLPRYDERLHFVLIIAGIVKYLPQAHGMFGAMRRMLTSQAHWQMRRKP
jgi:hypothetical protein